MASKLLFFKISHLQYMIYCVCLCVYLVTAAETATTSTAQSSVAQSTAALLQSNIASAAATSNVLPNLQYMLPGTAQGVYVYLSMCIYMYLFV